MKKSLNKSRVGFILLVLGCADAVELKNECTSSSMEAVNMCGNQSLNAFVQKFSVNPFLDASTQIIIPGYSFVSGNFSSGGDSKLNEICELKNDCCNALRLVDRFPSLPEFRWNSVNNELIVAAIFEAPVELYPNGLSIRNTGSIVWTWDSGMGTGSQSGGVTYVDYLDGKRVIDSKVTNEAPQPLERGKMYEWCVWAWNDEGTQIVSASSAIPFVVDELNIEKNDIRVIHGDWLLKSAIRKIDSQDLKDSFPLTHLTFNTDCSGGLCIINNLETVTINLRENQYIDFSDSGTGINSLKVNWLCQNSLQALTQLNGVEFDVLFTR